MLVNLLLLKGNIGRDGAGISPVRGHSNVQGQRTVGISEKPELVPLDKLRRTVRLRAAARKGHEHGRGLRGHARRQGEGLRRPRRQFRARHSRARGHGKGLEQLDLTVQIATKLNRSHLVNGKSRLSPAVPRPHREGHAGERPAGGVDGGHVQLHPRLDRPAQAGERASAIRGRDRRRAGQGDAPPNPKVKWDDWTGDYALVRDLIAET